MIRLLGVFATALPSTHQILLWRRRQQRQRQRWRWRYVCRKRCARRTPRQPRATTKSYPATFAHHGGVAKRRRHGCHSGGAFAGAATSDPPPPAARRRCPDRLQAPPRQRTLRPATAAHRRGMQCIRTVTHARRMRRNGRRARARAACAGHSMEHTTDVQVLKQCVKAGLYSTRRPS